MVIELFPIKEPYVSFPPHKLEQTMSSHAKHPPSSLPFMVPFFFPSYDRQIREYFNNKKCWAKATFRSAIHFLLRPVSKNMEIPTLAIYWLSTILS